MLVEAGAAERHRRALPRVERAGDLVEEEAAARVARQHTFPVGRQVRSGRGEVHQVVVRRAGLEDHARLMALRVVAPAHGTALVEDLALDAVERAAVEAGWIATCGRRIAREPDAAGV